MGTSVHPLLPYIKEFVKCRLGLGKSIKTVTDELRYWEHLVTVDLKDPGAWPRDGVDDVLRFESERKTQKYKSKEPSLNCF